MFSKVLKRITDAELNFTGMKAPAFLVILFLYVFNPSGASAQQTGDDPFGRSREIIRDLDSIVTPTGIQQRFPEKIGGVDQWVFVRGQDTANPLVLFVHGGPASPMAPVSWTFQRPLEEYFTMIQYDQRGSGKTFAGNDTSSLGETIRIDQYVEDAITLTEAMLKKYGKRNSF